MPTPTVITDLSSTAASNFPAGSDAPSTIDDTLRAHGAFIRQGYDGSNGVGYRTAGGAVTQLTDKSTAVTLNKLSGQITMHNASLAAGAYVSFTLNNSEIALTDVVALSLCSTNTTLGYSLTSWAIAGGCGIRVLNNLTGPLAEPVVINFAVIKAVAS
jgi:hypothetical protein